jgi:hypothetical protein
VLVAGRRGVPAERALERAELRHALGDCGARLLVVDAAFAGAARELQGSVAVLAAETLAEQAQGLTPLVDTRTAATRSPRSSTPAARPAAPRA